MEQTLLSFYCIRIGFCKLAVPLSGFGLTTRPTPPTGSHRIPRPIAGRRGALHLVSRPQEAGKQNLLLHAVLPNPQPAPMARSGYTFIRTGPLGPLWLLPGLCLAMVDFCFSDGYSGLSLMS